MKPPFFFPSPLTITVYLSDMISLPLHSNLSNNKITEIEDGAFEGASSVIELHLTANQIDSVRSSMFRGLEGLRMLCVRRKFSHMPGRTILKFNFQAEVFHFFPFQDAAEQQNQLRPQRQFHGAAQRPSAVSLRQPADHNHSRSLRHAADPLHAVRSLHMPHF